MVRSRCQGRLLVQVPARPQSLCDTGQVTRSLSVRRAVTCPQSPETLVGVPWLDRSLFLHSSPLLSSPLLSSTYRPLENPPSQVVIMLTVLLPSSLFFTGSQRGLIISELRWNPWWVSHLTRSQKLCPPHAPSCSWTHQGCSHSVPSRCCTLLLLRPTGLTISFKSLL